MRSEVEFVSSKFVNAARFALEKPFAFEPDAKVNFGLLCVQLAIDL